MKKMMDGNYTTANNINNGISLEHLRRILLKVRAISENIIY